MKLTKYLAGIAICVLSLQFYFQTQAQQLEIGDPIPDLLLDHIVNYPGGSARLSDFDGKLVIIDFWETWCAPCIKSLPHMQQLQQEFDGKLQVLLVSTQKEATIDAFLQKNNLSLPSVTESEYLNKLFPHKSVPYQVWIKDRRVFALTAHQAATSENIRGVLSGKLSSLAEKKFDFSYDPAKPLLLDGNGGQASDLQYRSLITGYIDGVGAGGVSTDSLGRYKLRALNANVRQLYTSVFRLGGFDPLARANRCILELDTAKVLPPGTIPAYAPEVRDKYFSYELIVPPTLKDRANELMLQDLNRFFGALYHIRGTVEKRTVECWVLRKKPGAEKKLASHSPEPENSLDKSGIRTCRKLAFDDFVRSLSYLYHKLPVPVVDQTGISGKIDISYPTKEEDISRFSDYIERYGLYLQLEPCTIDMLVIKQIE